MICEDALLLISGRVDGTNTSREEAQLEAHLASCPECRKVWQDFSAMNMELQNLQAEVSKDFCDSVMQEVKKQARKRHFRPLWRVLGAAAALALVIGLSSVPQEEDFSQKSRSMEPAAAYMAPEITEPAVVAQEYGADVVVISQLISELENSQYEELPGGARLYCLDDENSAVEWSKTYGLELYSPENKAVSDVSYALLMP